LPIFVKEKAIGLQTSVEGIALGDVDLLALVGMMDEAEIVALPILCSASLPLPVISTCPPSW
jgi:hypothetical protein